MKLTKAQIEERNRLTANVKDAQKALSDAIDEYNEKLGDVEATREDYDSAMTKFVEWRDTITTELREKYDDKTDNWRESDAGTAANEFIEKYEELDLTEVPAFDLEKLEAPDDMESTFDELPDEAGE